MPTDFARDHRRFAADDRGSVAMLFGIMFFVILMGAGVAIDWSRITHTNNRLTSAADAAVLVAGRGLLDGTMTDAEIIDRATLFFNENYEAAETFGSVDQLNIQLDRQAGTVQVTAEADVPMTITRIAGFQRARLPVTAAAVFQQQDIELGMALDVTGSMSGQKLADLKTAAKDLVDILLPEQPIAGQKVRIGLAPYSASVKLGAYAAAVSDGASKDGCVIERNGAAAYTDDAPGAGKFFLAGTAKTKDIDTTEGTSPYTCPNALVAPLTDDKDTLKNTIDTYAAGGYTGGHFGAAWAWSLISPNWSGVWPADSAPAAYGDDKTIKAIILMTDGIFNTAYNNASSAAQATSLCGAMKAADKNVIVYAVGFQAPSAAKATLQACASSTEHYFDATNGSELRLAFRQIAQHLTNLRLTN